MCLRWQVKGACWCIMEGKKVKAHNEQSVVSKRSDFFIFFLYNEDYGATSDLRRVFAVLVINY